MARNLARIWSNGSIPTTILISNWSSINLEETNPRTFKLRVALAVRSSPIRALLQLFQAPLTLFRTWRFLQSRQITAVAFHYPSLDALGIALLKRLKLYRGTLVLCFHGTDVRPPAHRAEALLWGLVFDSTYNVTACSKALSNEVQRSFERISKPVIPVYNGVDMAIFSPQAADSSCWDNLPALPEEYVVSVGSFIERKGHRFLLEGFSQIADRYPNLSLVVVGGDGAERSQLNALASSLGLTKRVQLLADLSPPQVAYSLARARFCVQPSIAEPFGMAVIEAGACGVAVAASAVGGHPELIDHEKTGLLFSSQDSSAIADTMRQLLDDNEARNAMAARFRNEILQRYTWEACADTYATAGRAEFPRTA